MDLLRGIAVVLVVFLHASPLETGVSGESGGWDVNLLFRPFRMPMLLVLSGLLLQHSLSKGARHYLVGKLRGIVWPWFLWMLVMVAVKFREISEDPIAFFTVATHLWFLAVLGCSYALALLTRRVPAVVTAVLLFALADLLQERSSLIPLYLWYAGFFFAGAALKPVLDRWLRARPPLPMMLASVALLGGMWQVSEGVTPMPYRLDQVLVSMAGVLAAVWLASRLPRVAAVLGLEWVGRDSIVMYLAHYPLTLVLWRVADSVGWEGAVAGLVIFFLVLGLCILLTHLRPWTGWLYRMPNFHRTSQCAEPVTTG